MRERCVASQSRGEGAPRHQPVTWRERRVANQSRGEGAPRDQSHVERERRAPLQRLTRKRVVSPDGDDVFRRGWLEDGVGVTAVAGGEEHEVIGVRVGEGVGLQDPKFEDQCKYK